MKNQNECTVFGPMDHIHHHSGTEESSCFYFPALPLAKLADEYGKSFVGRAARIEVNDVDEALHQHKGATIVFITSGSGVFRTKEEERPVRAGDVVYVPPITPHLSIADKNTVMIEWIVYLGDESDMQESLSV